MILKKYITYYIQSGIYMEVDGLVLMDNLKKCFSINYKIKMLTELMTSYSIWVVIKIHT